MKAVINAAQFNVTIENTEGVEVMTYSVENASFAIDMTKALNMVSEFSHLFKKLDASHNTDVFVNAQGERERKADGLELFGTPLTEHQRVCYDKLVKATHKMADAAAFRDDEDIALAVKLVRNADANDVLGFKRAGRALNSALNYAELSEPIEVARAAYRRARDLFTY